MATISQININGTDYAIAGSDTDPAAELLLSMYPVGSIYMSTVETSPEELFGGSWTRIEDTFLLAAGDTYAAGETGGEAEVTLSTSEMPAHTHTATPKGSVSSTFTGTAASHTHSYTYANSIYNDTSGSYTGVDRSATSSFTTNSTSVTPKGSVSSTFTGSSATSSSTGSGGAHNNMPPYYTVYMWYRAE